MDPLSDGRDNKGKIIEGRKIKRNMKKAKVKKKVKEKKTLVNSNQKVNKIIL
jgi:hypothetical protein